MKRIKLLMLLAVAAFAIGCAPTTKHLVKAEKSIEKDKYVEAAEAISKIKPKDFTYWLERESINTARTIIAIIYIYEENNRQANMILNLWVEQLKEEVDKEDWQHYQYKYNFPRNDYYYSSPISNTM